MSKSSDLNDVYWALTTGLQAAESLLTWQRGSEAYRLVSDRIDALKQGIKAYDSICNALRDGRMHIAYSDDDGDRGPVSVNLTEPDKGHVLCEDCAGEGTAMEMKCYGGSPIEVRATCDTCSGHGQLAISAENA